MKYFVLSGFRDKSEEKKVDFAFNVEKLKEEEFLNKLNSTVKRIGDYHEHLGLEDGGRKMKMQGVMKPDCSIDLKKHFAKPDYRAEKAAEEREIERKLLEKEAKTTVGAVKRLIQKVSSLAISDNIISNSK